MRFCETKRAKICRYWQERAFWESVSWAGQRKESPSEMEHWVTQRGGVVALSWAGRQAPVSR